MTKKAKTWTCAVAALACVAAVLCFALRNDAPYEVEYITAKVEKATIGNSVTATGTDNLDKEYLKERGIAWRNVAGYSTETVAQHTFALLFYLAEKLRYYDDYVKSERYVSDVLFTHFENVFHGGAGQAVRLPGHLLFHLREEQPGGI